MRPPGNRLPDKQHNNRADKCHDEAPNVEARHASSTKEIKDKSTEQTTQDSGNDIT